MVEMPSPMQATSSPLIGDSADRDATVVSPNRPMAK